MMIFFYHEFYLTIQEVKEVHKQILIYERVLLNTLNFDLNVTFPYTFCAAKVREFKCELLFMSVTTLTMFSKRCCCTFLSTSFPLPSIVYAMNYICNMY